MPAFNRSDFAGNPVRLDMSRSRFALNHKMKTTFNAGKLIPIYSNSDVLPGDTFEVSLSSLVRMSTPLFPVMDDAYIDVYWFFTPHDLTLSRQMMSPSVNDSNRSWKAYIGAQDSLLNMPTPSDVLLPFFQLGLGNGGIGVVHSLQDYLGLPLVGPDQCINCLEPLAYYSVWNSYFRDENTMNPVTYSVGSVVSSHNNPDLVGRAPIVLSGFDGRFSGIGEYLGYDSSILPVCRPHGYFGSALPWPQRNLSMVNISLASMAPLSIAGNNIGVIWNHSSGGSTLASGTALSVKTNDSSAPGSFVGLFGDAGSGDSGNLLVNIPSGAYADLSQAGGISVNQLRLLVQTQRWYEALARGGNRIGEMTASMFGVTPSDLAADRPEYLGGKRIRISMDQVANQAASLGELGAYSNTGDSSKYFTKSFDKWGTLQCMICVRTNESFTQGIARRYSRKQRFDHYWPQFANLGEQPILNKEIYVDPSGYNSKQDEVFGYQEAWAEYRYDPDQVSGLLRPDQSLGAYTYANLFNATPTLSSYLSGDGILTNVDRTLRVQSPTGGFQFIGDFAFNIVATRPMPRYSIPGLVDHH